MLQCLGPRSRLKSRASSREKFVQALHGHTCRLCQNANHFTWQRRAVRTLTMKIAVGIRSITCQVHQGSGKPRQMMKLSPWTRAGFRADSDSVIVMMRYIASHPSTCQGSLSAQVSRCYALAWPATKLYLCSQVPTMDACVCRF